MNIKSIGGYKYKGHRVLQFKNRGRRYILMGWELTSFMMIFQSKMGQEMSPIITASGIRVPILVGFPAGHPAVTMEVYIDSSVCIDLWDCVRSSRRQMKRKRQIWSGIRDRSEGLSTDSLVCANIASLVPKSSYISLLAAANSALSHPTPEKVCSLLYRHAIIVMMSSYRRRLQT